MLWRPRPPRVRLNPGLPLVQHLPELLGIAVQDAEPVRRGSVPGQQECNIDLNPSFLIRPAGSEPFCLVPIGAQTTLDLFGAKKITPFSM